MKNKLLSPGQRRWVLALLVALLGNFQANAWDKFFIKTYTPPQPPHVEGFSIVRSNSNDGVLVAGTVEYNQNGAVREMNAMRVNDAGTVIFNKNYYVVGGFDVHCMRIAPNRNGTGYLLIGYALSRSFSYVFHPVVVEINNVGTILNSKVFDGINGVFLDGTATPSGNYVFTGYAADGTQASTTILNTGRHGIVVKTNFAFAPSWQHKFNSSWASLPAPQNQHWDMGEKIIAFNHNGTEKYFITGGTRRWDAGPVAIPVAATLLLDNAGTLLWSTNRNQEEFGADAVFNPSDNKIYMICNKIVLTEQVSSLSAYDVSNGNRTMYIAYEGLPSSTWTYHFHDLFSYKLYIEGNNARIFGFVRHYVEKTAGGPIDHTPVYNPFMYLVDMTNLSSYSFTMFRKISLNYELNSDYLLGTKCTSCRFGTGGSAQPSPQIVTPDMALTFTSGGNNYYAIVSPAKKDLVVTDFSLNIINTISGATCNEVLMEMNAQYLAADSDTTMVFISPPDTPMVNNAQRNTLDISVSVYDCTNGLYSRNYYPGNGSQNNNTAAAGAAGIVSGLKEEEATAVLQVYPQPSTGILYLRLPDGIREEHFTVDLYAVTGTRIPLQAQQEDESVFSVDISGLAPGMYAVKLLSATGVYQAAVLKE